MTRTLHHHDLQKQSLISTGKGNIAATVSDHTQKASHKPPFIAEIIRLQRTIGNQRTLAFLRREHSSATAQQPEKQRLLNKSLPPTAGKVLNPSVRNEMESRFNADFSDVRVHTSHAATLSALDHNANAYTCGVHVVFGRGHYAPTTRKGKALIAHELAHVLQQKRSPVPVQPRCLLGKELENEATRAENAVVNNGLIPPVTRDVAVGVQRQKVDSARTSDEVLEWIHVALDAAGLFPVLGVFPDALNTGIYLIEGDWQNAGFSAAAMIPIFGQGATATKYGVRVTREADERVGREGLEQGLKETKTLSRKGFQTEEIHEAFVEEVSKWRGTTKQLPEGTDVITASPTGKQRISVSTHEEVLAGRLEKTWKRPVNHEAHHIVEKADPSPMAERARAILRREGIDIDDAANGVWVPKMGQHAESATAHIDLSNNPTYQKAVLEELLKAPPGTVRDKLMSIGRKIYEGTFPY